MSHKDCQEDGEQDDIKPSQIPLLDDVVFDSSLAFKPPRRKPKRENYSLDLNADPPRVLDLFSGEPAPLAGAEEPSGEEKNDKDERDDGEKDERDERAATSVQPPSPVQRAESMIREEADRMVDNLVQEYSQEIVRRLRDELTALLDDLEADRPPDERGDDGT